MATRKEKTKDFIQYLFNQQMDDSVDPPAMVLGMKGKAADGAYYPIAVNTDGKLVVNLEASTINIGDVDVLSSALPTGASTSAKQLADDHNVQISNKLIPEKWDYTFLAVDTLTDTWTFYTGGSGGTLVATVVITYTDEAKGTISNVAKT